MTNPTPQDREMARVLFMNALSLYHSVPPENLGIGRDKAVQHITQAITTARLQGRREGLEEAARVAWDLVVDYDKHWRAQIVAAIRTLYGAEPDKDGEG